MPFAIGVVLSSLWLYKAHYCLTLHFFSLRTFMLLSLPLAIASRQSLSLRQGHSVVSCDRALCAGCLPRRLSESPQLHPLLSGQRVRAYISESKRLKALNPPPVSLSLSLSAFLRKPLLLGYEGKLISIHTIIHFHCTFKQHSPFVVQHPISFHL